MARRRKTSAIDDMIQVAALMPWWAGVTLAGVSYFGLHWLAQPGHSAPPTQVADLAGTVQRALVQGLAGVGQYLVPGVCLAGAALSAFSKRKKRQSAPESGQAGAPGTPKNWDADRDRRSADLLAALNEPGQAEAPTTLDRAEKVEQLLDLIEWRRFEALVEKFFQHQGYTTGSQPHGADGGVDIKLYRGDDQKLSAVVQCKHWGKRSVGVELLRALRGSMAAFDAPRGFFVTSSTFTPEAAQFASSNQIEVIDRGDLVSAILALDRYQHQAILATALTGEYRVPTCASCGTKLVKRPGRKGGSPFWGCSNFPRCRTVMQLSRD